DRQDGAATAAPSDKKLGKITSTKVGSIYPTLTASWDPGSACVFDNIVRMHGGRPRVVWAHCLAGWSSR
ncbi:hypothetical protein, partial [Burkholderia stagnalis]|uniref:hypothetical protein n=1 Tax=Burkholderia stagnalis TaxID=1503054 RepID=UPI001ABB0DD1